jgi:hypothetical protein
MHKIRMGQVGTKAELHFGGKAFQGNAIYKFLSRRGEKEVLAKSRVNKTEKTCLFRLEEHDSRLGALGKR